METTKLGSREKASYGLGAVGKDMVYMFSASYILYYYQDILGVSAVAMGVILLVARVFDAFNDPIMGIVVAKTKTRWGKFRPWLIVGTVTNALILCLMFSVPPELDGSGLVAYAAVFYILWGITYTMMDIPYWSMVPAFTKAGKEREGLSALARSCAGVGSAVVSIITVMAVSKLGHAFCRDSGAVSMLEEFSRQPLEQQAVMHGAVVAAKKTVERSGFRSFAFIVAACFVMFTFIMCLCIKEKSTVDMKSSSVKDMFRSLFRNDQALVMVLAIVLINTALYITSNLVIYFFKYDFSGPRLWESHYTLFQTCSGGFQILAMMLLFPLLRKFIDSMKIFFVSFAMAFIGYVVLLAIAFSGTNSINMLLVPAFLIMSAIGMLNVIVTIFLANTVDYGQLKNGTRDESVIFSMQTFVVKLASGLSAFIASVVLSVFKIGKDIPPEALDESRMGLRLSVTVLPMVVLVIAVIVFKRHYILTDKKLEEIQNSLRAEKV